VSAQVAPNEARIAVRSGPLVAAVLSRVVGMLAARALCPIDRLDDALLVTDAIAAHAPNYTLNGRVIVTVSADDQALTLCVGPLRPQGAKGLLADAELPGVGNVLERMADEVSEGTAADGSGEELTIRLGYYTA
jgi:hypothetical protein